MQLEVRTVGTISDGPVTWSPASLDAVLRSAKFELSSCKNNYNYSFAICIVVLIV
jgi:hypothetical protein